MREVKILQFSWLGKAYDVCNRITDKSILTILEHIDHESNSSYDGLF